MEPTGDKENQSFRIATRFVRTFGRKATWHASPFFTCVSPILLVALGLLILTGCTVLQPAEEQPAQPSVDGQAEIWSGTAAPKQKIIVSVVELSEGTAITRIGFYLDPSLLQAQIFINNSQEGFTVASDPAAFYVALDLSTAPRSGPLEISFRSEETVLATCTLTVAERVIPSGDCGW